MSTNQKNNEEEIDLGSLFKIIGKGFQNLFNFIGNIFKGIYHFFILILIFIKSNFIKIAIAGIVGLVIGMLLEVYKPVSYSSTMLVEPNFKSTRQLYNNINFYNDLVKQKDTLTLQEIFDFDAETAGSLKKFEIEAIENNNDIIDGYDDLVEEVDTLTIKRYEFEEFKSSFTFYDYKIHSITVISEKNNVFEQVGDVIISSIVENKYFNRLKDLNNSNLIRTENNYKENLAQVDSLRKVYMQVMVDEAKKTSTGTSIDLGGEKRTTKEIELFETSRRINKDLKDITEEKSEKYDVLNVISNFQPVGSELKGVTKNYGFLFGVLFSGLMIVFLLLIKLNKYLDNYKKA